jgi:hypothetical protein
MKISCLKKLPSRIYTEGRVSDIDFGLAALHALVGVTAGAKPRNDPLSLSFSTRSQHGI